MNPLAEEIRGLMDLDAKLAMIGDLDILLERILSEARKLVRADAGSVYVLEGESLVIRVAQNDKKQRQLPRGRKLIYTAISVPVNSDTLAGHVARTRQPINVPNVQEISADALYRFDPAYDRVAGYQTTSVLVLPLVTFRGDVLGVVQVINAIDSEGNIGPFDADAERLVRHFALSAASALNRAAMTRTILMRMILMAQMRDPKETGAHVNRVAGYAVELYDHWAVHHNISNVEREKNRDLLRMASMLHDVGKVAISDLLLKKPAAFTPQEKSIMETHAFLGAKLFVDSQSELDDMAAIIALMHHECWDGSGYPGKIDLETGLPLSLDGKSEGLKGEEISIFARITSLADVYDALRSARAYKSAWNEQDVYEEVKRQRGKKFDPEIVDIFFEILPEIEQVATRYQS